MKKVIIIIIFGLAAFGAGAYIAWKNAKTVLTPSKSLTPSQNPGTITIPQNNQNTSATAALSETKLKTLSDEPAFDYWILSAGNSVFYLSADGKIFKAADGQDEIIVSEPILNLRKIYSTFDGKRVLIEYGGLDSPKFKLFNSETKIFEMLPENMIAANFSPDGKKIAYLDKSGNLMIKDLTAVKSQTVKIMAISQSDFNIDWILPEKIALSPKPSAFYPASAWAVDAKNKTIVSLTSELNGLMIKWSADGKIGLEFSTESQGGTSRLNLINEKGAVMASVDFATLPDKCLISQPRIYCAVPRGIPAKVVLPDDYLKRAVYFDDIFYQIDIAQNSFTEIPANSQLVIDAVDLRLVNSKLFFINRYDNKVYSLGI